MIRRYNFYCFVFTFVFCLLLTSCNDVGVKMPFLSMKKSTSSTFSVVATTATSSLGSRTVELICLSALKNPVLCKVVKDVSRALIQNIVTSGGEDGVNWQVTQIGDESQVSISTENEKDAVIIASLLKEQLDAAKRGEECGIEWDKIMLPESCRSIAFQTHAICESYKEFNNIKDILFGNDITLKSMRNMKEALGIEYDEEIFVMMDASFWTNGKEGMAATKTGIYFTYYDPNTGYKDGWVHIPWEYFFKTGYQQQVGNCLRTYTKPFSIEAYESVVQFSTEFKCSKGRKKEQVYYAFSVGNGDFKAFEIVALINDLKNVFYKEVQ